MVFVNRRVMLLEAMVMPMLMVFVPVVENRLLAIILK
jgi:hypothetical protein